jgi:hypothetical protein
MDAPKSSYICKTDINCAESPAKYWKEKHGFGDVSLAGI